MCPRIWFGRTGKLGSVVADRLDRAAFLGFFATGLFLWIFGLFADERVSAVFIALEIVRCSFAAQVAVNALVVHVKFARDIFGIFICNVGHKLCG